MSKKLSPFTGELGFHCEGVLVDEKDPAEKYEGKEVTVTNV